MKQKITLNEELNRMLFLSKVRSGKLMTISEIAKTYINEQDNTTSTTSNQPRFSFEEDEGNFIVTPQGAERFIVTHKEKEFTFQGVPAVIQLRDPNMRGVVNTKFEQLTGSDNPLTDFFNTIRLLINSNPFATPLTLDKEPISDGLSNNLGILYGNLVTGPMDLVLQRPPFNLPPPPRRGRDYDWTTYFNNLSTMQLSPQDISILRNAVTASQIGLKKFTDSLANPSKSRYSELKGIQSPIRGFTPPQVFSGGQGAGAMLSVAEAGSGASNDSVLITLILSSFAFKGSLNNSESITAINVTKRLMNAFYSLIRDNRQQRKGSGNLSAGPIIIPTLDQLFNDTEVMELTNTWGDLREYKEKLKLEAIDITIKSAFPNLVTLPS